MIHLDINPPKPDSGPAEVVVSADDGSQAAILKCHDWAAASCLHNAIKVYATGLEVQMFLGAESEPGI